MRSSADKIMTLDAALEWRRRQDGTVVFTNGVFDILHPGHVYVLERARAEGDSLVVAINDDRSAERLGKGRNRPIAALEARIAVVAGLEATDCVFRFSEDTPEREISLLDPDVLVKGADYEGTDVPGASHVVSQGGRVVFVPLLQGHSSSTIVEKIRGTPR